MDYAGESADSLSPAEVVERILDRGVVIDAWARASLVGIELLSMEARAAVAAMEESLKHPEHVALTPAIAAPTEPLSAEPASWWGYARALRRRQAISSA
jgi:hypothetical protein